MIRDWWRTALGTDRQPSEDQIEAITAPHTGHHSVDAGAGTGKTSTLALRALYLIESDRVRPDQIVVVTFTKKAAAEIGARIADAIDRAIEAGADLPGDGRGVRCTTIHGLASEIRRENAFDLGLAAPPRTVSDGEAHAIFHDAFRALLEGRLDVDASQMPIAELNLAHLERDLGNLALRLKNLGVSPDVFEARALLEADRFAEQTWGQVYAVGERKPRIKCVPDLAVTPAEIACEAERERANVRVVAALYRRFDASLGACGAATYGDLIASTTAALRARPELVTTLRARWRYVLLDESQDTSGSQLAFIETLFGTPGEPDAAGIMPVGDRRQAIYGFNDATEAVMDRLAEHAERSHPLTKNRRSYQEIVDAAHAVLAAEGIVDATTPALHAQNGSGTLDCVRLQTFGEATDSMRECVEKEARAIASEVRALLEAGRARTSDIAILIRRRTHAATYLRELNRLDVPAALDRRSGLLVAPEIRDVLAWMALLLDPCDRQAAVRVLQSPLCDLSDATMIALADESHWLERFLRDELPRTGERALDAETHERLARVRDLLVALLPSVSVPLAAAMRDLLTQLPIAAAYVALGRRENADAIGAQAIVNLASFDVLAREFAAEHPRATLRDFAEDVARRILYDDDVQEPELDLDGVRILTIHQAKGLEWDYVFVACSTKAQYGTSSPSDRVVAYDLASGAFTLKTDVDGRQTFRWLCIGEEHDRATGERLAEPTPRRTALSREQARVFYVALTRARKRVYVTAPSNSRIKEATYLDAIREWATGKDDAVALAFHTGTSPREVASRTPFGLPVVERAAAPVEEIASTRYAARLSFTSISSYETCERQARYRYRYRLPNLRDGDPRLPGVDGDDMPHAKHAAALGTLVHRALELWGRATIEGAPVPFSDAFENARIDVRDDVSRADREVARACGERAVVRLADFSLLAVEYPFETRVGETLVTGSIDVVARDATGTLWVIDYKTGRAPGEKYGLQLALYGRVVERNFPGDRVTACILRLTPNDAEFEMTAPISPGEIARRIRNVDGFASDEAKPGPWCAFCAYEGSPCQAWSAVAGS